jgi:hypothetical protein
LEAMNASVLVRVSANPRCGLSGTLRVANGVSLRVSNPHLRLGPCTPLWLPDERVESIEMRAPAHRDHTKRRIVITDFAAS